MAPFGLFDMVNDSEDVSYLKDSIHMSKKPDFSIGIMKPADPSWEWLKPRIQALMEERDRACQKRPHLFPIIDPQANYILR